jgi:hypothetical protein
MSISSYTPEQGLHVPAHVSTDLGVVAYSTSVRRESDRYAAAVARNAMSGVDFTPPRALYARPGADDAPTIDVPLQLMARVSKYFSRGTPAGVIKGRAILEQYRRAMTTELTDEALAAAADDTVEACVICDIVAERAAQESMPVSVTRLNTTVYPRLMAQVSTASLVSAVQRVVLDLNAVLGESVYRVPDTDEVVAHAEHITSTDMEHARSLRALRDLRDTLSCSIGDMDDSGTARTNVTKARLMVNTCVSLDKTAASSVAVAALETMGGSPGNTGGKATRRRHGSTRRHAAGMVPLPPGRSVY